MKKRTSGTGFKLKYYGYKGDGYTGERYKIAGRVVIVLAAVMIIFIGSVILGNYLGSIAAETSADTAPEAEEPDEVKLPSGSNVSEPSEKAPSIIGDYFDPSLYETSDDMTDALDRVAAGAYTAVTLPLTSPEGTLLYESEVLSVAARGYTHPDAPAIGLRSVFTAADAMRLRTTALFYVRPSLFFGGDDKLKLIAVVDALLAKELSDEGLDEIIICGADSGGGDVSFTETAENLTEYITEIKKSAPELDITIALSPDVYKNALNAPYVEQLFSTAGALAIDLSALISGSSDPYGDTDALCASLSGSFKLYNLRALLDGKSAEIKKAQLDALALHGITNWQFVTAPENEN